MQWINFSLLIFSLLSIKIDKTIDYDSKWTYPCESLRYYDSAQSSDTLHFIPRFNCDIFDKHNDKLKEIILSEFSVNDTFIILLFNTIEDYKPVYRRSKKRRIEEYFALYSKNKEDYNFQKEFEIAVYKTRPNLIYLEVADSTFSDQEIKMITEVEVPFGQRFIHRSETIYWSEVYISSEEVLESIKSGISKANYL